MKIQFNREIVAGIVKELKVKKPKYILISVKGERGKGKVVLTEDAKEDNIIFRLPIVRFANFHLKTGYRYGEDESYYDEIVGENREKLEDIIYYDIKEKVKVIESIGFLASEGLLAGINRLTSTIQKAKEVEPIKQASYKQLKVPERVVELYKKENDPWFSRGIRINKEEELFELVSKEPILTRLERMVALGSEQGGEENHVREIKKQLSIHLKNVQKLYYEKICELVSKFKNVDGFTEQQIMEGLNSYLYDLTNIIRGGSVVFLKKHLDDLKDFYDKYEDGAYIKSIKPVLNPKSRRPYLLIEGELDRYEYLQERGNYGYYVKFSEATGVTKVGENKYLVTLKAYNKFEESDTFREDLNFALLEAGEWKDLYDVGGKIYLTINKNTAESINKTGEFTLITFNENKEGYTMLGMKYTLFKRTYGGYGNGYELIDEDDDSKELLDEIYNKTTSPGLFTSKYRRWKQGYNVRNSEIKQETIELMKRDNNKLTEIYQSIEEEVLKELEQRYGEKLESYGDLRKIDGMMGLDSGFVSIYYVDDGLEFERVENNKRARSERRLEDIIGFDKCYPPIQSLTIKRPIANRVISEFNKVTPNRKVTVKYVLD